MEGTPRTGRKTWENIPALALLVVGELLLDHADDNIVADQTALVHDLLGLSAEGSLLCNLRSQHIAGSLRSARKEVRNMGFLSLKLGDRN